MKKNTSLHDRVRMRNARAARTAYIRSIRRKVTAAVISAVSVLTAVAALVGVGIIRVF